ncbi:MAG: pyridoxal phosphate-dependent aminotransferase [Bacteroidaceae bacterium]|nr:pyridoxal phosphate-dependent aminotransferase [Bacteroidaceae bacterium]
MKYNFDEIIPRKHTNCLKYDNVMEIFGTEDILPMWIADMDFRTPDFIVDAIRKRLDHEVLGYTYCCSRWKPAIINWVSRRYAWTVNEEEIGFVGGIVPAISFALQCFTKVGDKVLVQPPVYHPYHHVTHDLERTLVTNPLKLVGGQLEVDFVDFEEKVKDCKMFLLCNPHNPGGRVWSKEELVRMCEICAKYNVLVISDEIHCDMTLKGYKHIPFASCCDKAKDICITFMAASKTFNIAGLKSSYHIIQNSEVRQQYHEFLRKSELDTAHVFATGPVATAYEKGEEWVEQMLEYVEANIDFMEQYLKDNMPKMGMIRPQASFLVFLDARGLGLPHDKLVEFFVREAKVGMNDGAMFGEEGSGYMRMNLGCPRSVLEKALNQIKAAYDKIGC